MTEDEKIEKHTQIFASMCPDEILDHYDDYNTREYYTTLMLGDISGFTEVAEKYTNAGKGGPSKLTETLNSYIGAMVQEILSHHGDVLKFSGDAFIVMWKLRGGLLMGDLANEAMQTACVIQKHFGTYETDVGITLKVKLAIASGKTYFTSIGDPERISHYIITGKPVWDVKHAEGLCRGGDILVARSSWQWANPTDYVFKNLSDGIHTLILASSTMWEHPKDEYDATEEKTPTGSILLSSVPSNIDPPESDSNGSVPANFGEQMEKNQLQLLQSHVDYTLRPKVIMMTKKRMKNQLRSYMLWPVIRSVELNEPLEHLTEIRQVVIVFVNVITYNIGKIRLISLVNTTYKTVCRIVSEMHGCVNKTSLFDKDLMFLCIFGLRGGKQEFESQIGLRCASKIKSVLSDQKYIESVTIGVSTGMTYCGVVGHVLRREYTVMGLPVNKAARLMVTYNNKVICDRESFLHSRLEARHFILQEYKNLKGISKAGPIYEYLERITPEEKEAASLYPLLGREAELKIFRMLLMKAKKNWNELGQQTSIDSSQNVLIIRGEPRTGKSRLLQEMSEIIPKDIPCNYIKLNENEDHPSFTLIYTMLCVPLGFTSTTTSTERQNTLISHLKQNNHQNDLCALNQVLNVEFQVASHYSKLSYNEKNEILKNLISILVEKCFGDELWIIIIDNVDHADKESLALLDTFMIGNRIIVLMSITDTANEYLLRIMETANVIDVSGLDKWFHAGLACQFLDVVAIPPELEKTIQERSMGNPGWIESYLLSLKQINGIELKNVSRKNLREMGLVIPPSLMLKKKPQSRVDDPTMNEYQERTDGWKMYETSYEGSTISLLGISSDAEQEIVVCTIPNNLQLEDVSPELTTDVMFLKLFDSLTPLDQILLKCTAVLGETIDRNLVETLMENTTIYEIGFSIKNLFEMKILGCASAEFEKNFRTSFYFNTIKKSNKSMEIRCGCSDVTIREELTAMPKYASCRLLRFQIEEFREATYRLLTENQKVELHKKALTYLQRNTKKCKACGGGVFTRLHSDSYHMSPSSSKTKSIDTDDYLDFFNFDSTHHPEPSAGKKSDMRKWSRRFIMLSEVEVPPRTFSDLDFTNCQCNSILITVYIQILDHYRGIGRIDKALMTILEFVEVLLATSNFPQATKLLQDAETILNQIFKSRSDELIIHPCLRARIKTLRAKYYLQSGLVNEALNTLEAALANMGYHFPKSIFMIKIKAKYLFQRQKWMLMCMPNETLSAIDLDTATYYNQLSRCLCEIYNIFRMTGMQEHAHLAAIWSFNAALISNRDYIVLCTAYANMIYTAHEIHNAGIAIFLENDGLTICNERENDIELNELQAIALLYLSICYSHLMKGETSKVIHLGYITLKLTRAVRSVKHELYIIPRLIYVLMIQCRYKEIPPLLEKLEFISNSDLDKSGRTWYYALCTDLQLDTGIRVTSIDDCERYYQQEGNAMVKLRDSDALRRYFTSMWLWHLRMNDWASATIWRARKQNAAPQMDDLTIVASVTALKKLEALLIYYVRKVDSRDAKAIRTTFYAIQKQFKIINRLEKVVKPIIPRHRLMKAYYHMIFGQSRSSLKLLQESRAIANEMGNKLILAWADQCQKAWTGALTENPMNKWEEKGQSHSNYDDCLIENDEQLVALYTLPLPVYISRHSLLHHKIWYYRTRLKFL